MHKRNITLMKNGPHTAGRGFIASVLLSMAIVAWCVDLAPKTKAQTVAISPTLFRIGEKLSYNLSFGKIQDGGFAELYVASRGKLSGQDVVQLHSRARTEGIVRAAFFMLDESRTVFVAPDTGQSLYVSRVTHEGPEPTEVISNYLKDPSPNLDLLTVIYKAREAGGIGTYAFLEGGQTYTATFQIKNKEKVQVEAGEFETSVSNVQSTLFAAKGVKEVKINFTNDENRIPVLIRVKTSKGELRASLLSVNIDAPVVAPTPAGSPTPKPAVTPKPGLAPRPTASPTPYVENQPLSPELGFQLGETLNYNITTGGKPVAAVTFSAVERNLYQKKDSLLLSATIAPVSCRNLNFKPKSP